MMKKNPIMSTSLLYQPFAPTHIEASHESHDISLVLVFFDDLENYHSVILGGSAPKGLNVDDHNIVLLHLLVTKGRRNTQTDSKICFTLFLAAFGCILCIDAHQRSGIII